MEQQTQPIEELEDIAVVRAVQGTTVTVEMMKTGACDSCAMSGVCVGHDKTVQHTIQTDRQLAVGDTVRVSVSPGMRIFSSVIIFLFPILCMILFYLVSRYVVHTSENLAILLSFVGLLLSGLVVYGVDKKCASRIRIEIVEKVQ
jgi:positive regulator of sigma E activity